MILPYLSIILVRPLPMPSILDDQEIHDYIQAKAGSPGLSMVQLIEQGFTTIIEIAEELRIPRRAARKILYQMNKDWILGYKRFRKDGKINFMWFTTPVKIHSMVRNGRKDEIRELEERIKFEQDHKFFDCRTCKGRCLYTEAMDFGFICELCGEPLEPCNTENLVEDLRARLKKLLEVDGLDIKVLDEAGEISEGHRPVDVEKIGTSKPGSFTTDPPKRKRSSKKKDGPPPVKDEWSSKPETDEEPIEEDKDDEEFLDGEGE
jgi:transcription initiation factor TFIIE subunit alpha